MSLISRPTAGTDVLAMRTELKPLARSFFGLLAAAVGVGDAVDPGHESGEDAGGGDLVALASCRGCPRRGSTCAGRCRSAARSAGPAGRAPCRRRGRRRPGRGRRSGRWPSRSRRAGGCRRRRRGSRGPSPRTSPSCRWRCRAPCPARSSRGPGSGSGAVADWRTLKISLATSLVPSKTVSVTWSRGASSASSGVPCRGVPSSSSSRMLAKSNASCVAEALRGVEGVGARGQALDHQGGRLDAGDLAADADVADRC